jgi:hypothetical protein
MSPHFVMNGSILPPYISIFIIYIDRDRVKDLP